MENQEEKEKEIAKVGEAFSKGLESDMDAEAERIRTQTLPKNEESNLGGAGAGEKTAEELAKEKEVASKEEVVDENFSWADAGKKEPLAEKPAEFKVLSADEISKLPEAEKKVYEEKLSKNIPTFDFATVSKEIGLQLTEEPKDLTTFTKLLKDNYEKVNKENEQLRSLTLTNGVNEEIQVLTELKDKNDEDVVRNDLRIQKMPDAEITEYLNQAKESGTIVLKAKEIRNAINNVIKKKREDLVANLGKPTAKQLEEEAENVKALQEFQDIITKTETMFGFKIGLTEEEKKRVQAEHYAYVQSGQYAREIYATHESLLQASWLWRFKNVILKAEYNKGFQKGKAEILGDVKEPELGTTNRHREPIVNNGSAMNEQQAKAFADGL